MRSSFSSSDLIAGARFLFKLPSFLRRPVSLMEARAALRQRLDNREADFLFLARHSIYPNPESPYLKLLCLAGCESGDLEKLLQQDGLDGTLRKLFHEGVYLTGEEYRCRTPVVRGSTTFHFEPAQFANPMAAHHITGGSSGSRGSVSLVPMDLAFIRDRAVNLTLALESRGGTRWHRAIWGVPGSTALIRALEACACGNPPKRLFSMVDLADGSLHPRYRLSARAMRWGGLCAGVPLPRTEYVPLSDPLPIARWMRGVLQRGATPFLHVFASPAVRLCLAAMRAGIDISGARFWLGGEPITDKRHAVMEEAGVIAETRYATVECGTIGFVLRFIGFLPKVAAATRAKRTRTDPGVIHFGWGTESCGIPRLTGFLSWIPWFRTRSRSASFAPNRPSPGPRSSGSPKKPATKLSPPS